VCRGTGRLLGEFDTVGGTWNKKWLANKLGYKTDRRKIIAVLTKSLLDVTVDGELTGGQTTDHEQSGGQTSERAAKTKLASDLDQSAHGALAGRTLGLVDLGEHSVGRLRNDSGTETGKKTRSKVDTGLGAARELRLVGVAEDDLGNLLESGKLGDGVGNSVRVIMLENVVESSKKVVDVTYCLNRMGPKPL
jgi:hypothetical protein